MSKHSKAQKHKAKKEISCERKVKMTFSECKFYNDLQNPIFEPGKVYELEGVDWIQRWEKRGGTIIEVVQEACEGTIISGDSDKEEEKEETDSDESVGP